MVNESAILEMKRTLESNGIDIGVGYSWSRYQLRKSGHYFTFEEHIEAMMISLLSANRPSKQLEENIDNLREVFRGYNPEYLKSENPYALVEKVKSINCGNKAIVRQMEGIKHNVEVFEETVSIVGDMEYLVTNNDPIDVSAVLSMGHYKLAGFAQTLALQYLRNVGIDTFKPDLHIRRILSRLFLIPYEDCSIADVDRTMKDLSRKLQIPVTLVNEVIWDYGGTGAGEICTKVPKCYLCNIKECPSRRS